MVPSLAMSVDVAMVPFYMHDESPGSFPCERHFHACSCTWQGRYRRRTLFPIVCPPRAAWLGSRTVRCSGGLAHTRWECGLERLGPAQKLLAAEIFHDVEQFAGAVEVAA